MSSSLEMCPDFVSVYIRDQICKWSFNHTRPILQLYNFVSDYAKLIFLFTAVNDSRVFPLTSRALG